MKNFNPLALIAMKQKIGIADANTIALPILIYLDAAHRGKANIEAENSLVRLVVMTQVIGSMAKNRAFYDVALRAGVAMMSACGRQAALLSFTTGEYRAVRAMIAAYLRILPTMEISLLTRASVRSAEIVSGMPVME